MSDVSTPPVVLASSSPWRRQQLGQLGLAFEAISPDVDETPLSGERPIDLARRLARAKAETIAGQRPDAIVIGADQVANVEGDIVGKPGDAATARKQLARQSGREVYFHSGLCVCAPTFAAPRATVITVVTRFRDLDAEEIARYVAAEDVTATAGSMKCEGLGISLAESIASEDPSALIGLPLIALCGLLRDAGVPIP